ncbi:MAG TPA: hypothetical protein VG871_12340 [Vicinamibacterales bacterium]|nr:hypothetical protein [Vicinamibacterales bacterium]
MRLGTISAVVVLIASSGYAANQTVHGTISDAMCGASHAGEAVNITGDVKGDTIRVSKVDSGRS